MNPFRSREYFITIKEYSTLSLSRKCHLLPFLLGLFVRLSFHSVQPFSVSFFTQSSTLFFFHCERVPPLSPIHPSHRVVNATCRKDIKWLGEYWHSSGTLIWRSLPLSRSFSLSSFPPYTNIKLAPSLFLSLFSTRFLHFFCSFYDCQKPFFVTDGDYYFCSSLRCLMDWFAPFSHWLTAHTFTKSEVSSVTRLGDLLGLGQLFKALGNDYFAQIFHILRQFL